MKKLTVIFLIVLITLCIQITKANAGGGQAGTICDDIHNKVPISSIDTENRRIKVLITTCDYFWGFTSIYYWFLVPESSIVKIAGQSGFGTFEDLSTEGQEIIYQYYYDDLNDRLIDSIVIFMLE